MWTRARLVLLLLAAVGVAAEVTRVSARSGTEDLTVHEWGTFTSVAGADGQSVEWAPLSGPEDLPCFVDRTRPVELNANAITNIQVKGRDIYGFLDTLSKTPATVGAAVAGARPSTPLVPAAFVSGRIRMETPVLYFYAPAPLRVDVNVGFHQGAMSEWYPKAAVPRLDLGRPLSAMTDTITWSDVEIRPGPDAAYPRENAPSHYYAAREVDAAPLRVGSQDEKFLFYRGVADFQPPLGATIADASVTVRGLSASGNLVLFENRGGRVGYRIVRADGDTTVSRPELTGSVDALGQDLVAMLTAEGLYPREARAMVDTWRDSWFEAGARIFYLVPTSVIDERLPLSVSPSPSQVTRVFVGRLELITDEMKDDVERALAEQDLDTLSHYGRFLDSIVLQIADRPSISANPVRVFEMLKAVATPSSPAACGQRPPSGATR